MLRNEGKPSKESLNTAFPDGIGSITTTGFPLLEMDATIKTNTWNHKNLEDKTDSDSCISSNNSIEESIALKDIKVLKTIGSGRFGFVKIGYHTLSNRFICLNTYHKNILSDTCQQHIPSREKEILQNLLHPFISQYMGSFQNKNCLYLMLDVNRGGDLSRLLVASSLLEKSPDKKSSFHQLSKPLSEANKIFYAACVVSVFKYAHSKNILYRGLHPDTLHIDEKGFLKVVDWGFAKHVEDYTFTLCGHVEYLCPEAILYDSGYGKGADYWALGVLIYDMLAGRSAFVATANNGFNSETGYDDASTVENIISSEVTYPDHFSSSACSVISSLLQRNPNNRLGATKNGRGAKDVMNHPWFSCIDWDKLETGQMTPPWIPRLEKPDDLSLFGDGMATEEVVSDFDGYHHVEWSSFHR